MGVRRCSVRDCKSNSIDDLSVHMFPTDYECWKNWAAFLKSSPDIRKPRMGSGFGICSKHFEANCFRNLKQFLMGYATVLVLHKGACPTILDGEANNIFWGKETKTPKRNSWKLLSHKTSESSASTSSQESKSLDDGDSDHNDSNLSGEMDSLATASAVDKSPSLSVRIRKCDSHKNSPADDRLGQSSDEKSHSAEEVENSSSKLKIVIKRKRKPAKHQLKRVRRHSNLEPESPTPEMPVVTMPATDNLTPTAAMDDILAATNDNISMTDKGTPVCLTGGDASSKTSDDSAPADITNMTDKSTPVGPTNNIANSSTGDDGAPVDATNHSTSVGTMDNSTSDNTIASTTKDDTPISTSNDDTMSGSHEGSTDTNAADSTSIDDVNSLISTTQACSPEHTDHESTDGTINDNSPIGTLTDNSANITNTDEGFATSNGGANAVESDPLTEPVVPVPPLSCPLSMVGDHAHSMSTISGQIPMIIPEIREQSYIKSEPDFGLDADVVMPFPAMPHDAQSTLFEEDWGMNQSHNGDSEIAEVGDYADALPAADHNNMPAEVKQEFDEDAMPNEPMILNVRTIESENCDNTDATGSQDKRVMISDDATQVQMPTKNEEIDTDANRDENTIFALPGKENGGTKGGHCVEILRQLYAMQKLGKFCDFTICIKPWNNNPNLLVRGLKVHKNVFASMSKKIRCWTKDVLILDCTYTLESIHMVVEFAYTGQIRRLGKLGYEKVISVWRTGLMLDISKLGIYIMKERPDVTSGTMLSKQQGMVGNFKNCSRLFQSFQAWLRLQCNEKQRSAQKNDVN